MVDILALVAYEILTAVIIHCGVEQIVYWETIAKLTHSDDSSTHIL